MTKQSDIDDLLGDATPTKPAAKAKSKEAAKPATKAKPEAKGAAPKAKETPKKEAAPKAKETPKPATKAKPEAKEAAPKAKRVKEPVVFAEGERDDLIARAKKLVKKPISSKDLAAKLEVDTRKLRPVLYSMERAGFVSLELGASRTAGLTVSPAAA